MKRILVLFLLMLCAPAVYPCLILVYTLNDRVIVGNHEDWPARDARIRFIPAADGELGLVAFDFESEGLIQGGVNEAGLFFDGTATPFSPVDFSGKEAFNGKDFWLTLLQTCRNVTEAVAFIDRYAVPELEQVHILFADKSGQSVIIGTYDGKLTYTWKSKPFQVLTNFNIVDPEYGGEQPCPRFATATQLLSKTPSTADPMKVAQEVLEQTTQGQLTAYSTLFDLTTGRFRIFYTADFSRSLGYSIAEELRRGKHDVIVSQAMK